MICEYCGKEFFEEWRKDKRYIKNNLLKFCSKNCASGFSTKNKRKEINKKVEKKLKEFYKNNASTGNKFQKGFDPRRKIFTKEDISKGVKASIEKLNNFYIGAKWEEIKNSRVLRKRRIIEEQNFKCNKCKLKDWFDEPLIFEIHHKDGNKKNNDRNNVECLCPNCHSQTDTWRRNNKGQLKETGTPITLRM